MFQAGFWSFFFPFLFFSFGLREEKCTRSGILVCLLFTQTRACKQKSMGTRAAVYWTRALAKVPSGEASGSMVGEKLN